MTASSQFDSEENDILSIANPRVKIPEAMAWSGLEEILPA